MKTIGIMGGTFDPIHIGHLITAQYVYEKRNLDKIIFIPAFISPHKLKFKSSNSKYRLNMIKKAIKGIKHFDCSDFELKNKGISFTVDTLIHFKKTNPKIELIIGEDNYIVFDKWKDPEKIIELANLVVLRRRIKNLRESKKFPALFLDSPIIEISSTEIRERVRKGKSIRFLVPKSVEEYIYSLKLYME